MAEQMGIEIQSAKMVIFTMVIVFLQANICVQLPTGANLEGAEKIFSIAIPETTTQLKTGENGIGHRRANLELCVFL